MDSTPAELMGQTVYINSNQLRQTWKVIDAKLEVLRLKDQAHDSDDLSSIDTSVTFRLLDESNRHRFKFLTTEALSQLVCEKGAIKKYVPSGGGIYIFVRRKYFDVLKVGFAGRTTLRKGVPRRGTFATRLKWHLRRPRPWDAKKGRSHSNEVINYYLESGDLGIDKTVWMQSQVNNSRKERLEMTTTPLGEKLREDQVTLLCLPIENENEHVHQMVEWVLSAWLDPKIPYKMKRRTSR